MASYKTRIAPLNVADWGDAQREVVLAFVEGLSEELQRKKEGKHHDMAGLGLLLNYPALARAYLPYSSWMLQDNALGVRHRELLILRIAWRRKCDYEWAQHVLIALDFDYSDEEIRSVGTGADAPVWSSLERLLLSAADELIDCARISDDTWEGLSGHYDDRQMLELLHVVGTYDMVAMTMNSTGIPLSDELQAVRNQYPLGG